MEADFSGWATKAGQLCADGRTIMPDAFKEQDATRVPLVWQHSHNDPENVLGHVLLENRNEGVYCYGFFNKSRKAQAAKEAIQHEDIDKLSIYANRLTERAKKVMHGVLREVSLVLASANPGAVIEDFAIAHADGSIDPIDGAAIIYTGIPIVHSDESEVVNHMEDKTDTTEEPPVTDDGRTIEDVVNGMDEDEQKVLHYLIGEAITGSVDEKSVEHTDTKEEAESDTVEHSDLSAESTDTTDKEEVPVKHNVFEDGEANTAETSLSHDVLKEILGDAERTGSLKRAFQIYAKDHLEHGIDSLDVLFPDAKLIGTEPEMLSRRMEWVNSVLTATRKSPFARIRTVHADITEDEARAKGYVTGEFKREEFFSLAKRETVPQTVYKKQKLERDDIVDITDLDVVTWLKGEMRVMLDEEIARAALIGDGRDINHPDKIKVENIRPVAFDHELYTSVVNINLDAEGATIQQLIDVIVANRSIYKGTGMPTLYTSETIISRISLLKNAIGERIYKSLADFASEIRVKEIVPVEAMDDVPEVVAILVNMADYNFGTDKGGEVNMFDDFDIDYNNYKYLIETRLSGALVRLKSAIVYLKVDGDDVMVTPTAPSFDDAAGEVTITNTTGVVYKNGAGATINAASSPYAVAPGAVYTVHAEPAAGYYFPTSDGNTWKFRNTEL